MMSDTDASQGPVERGLELLAQGCLAIAGVQMVTLIIVFSWLVFGRYVLNDTPTWVEQLSLLLVVWITFLGAAAGVWYRTHLSIEFIRESLPRPFAVPMEWAALIGMTIFGGFLFWQGWALSAGTWTRHIPMLGIPEGWRAVPMAICGSLTVLFSLYQLSGLLPRRTTVGE